MKKTRPTQPQSPLLINLDTDTQETIDQETSPKSAYKQNIKKKMPPIHPNSPSVVQLNLDSSEDETVILNLPEERRGPLTRSQSKKSGGIKK